MYIRNVSIVDRQRPARSIRLEAQYRRLRKLQDILFPGRDSNHVPLECQIDALPNRTPEIERGDRVISISVYKSGSPGFKFRPRHGCPELGVFVVFLRSSRQMPGSVSQTGPRPLVSISFLLYLFTDRSAIRRVRPNSERLDFHEMNCQQVNKQTSRLMTGVQKYKFLKEFVSSLQLGFSVKILSLSLSLFFCIPGERPW
jgi:hypothetical protein